MIGLVIWFTLATIITVNVVNDEIAEKSNPAPTTQKIDP